MTTTEKKVQQYIDDVLAGNKVVCKYTKLAVQRHVNDLARQSTEGFPYYFNRSHALAACEFFSLVIKHSTGDYQGQPFVLEPWQAFGVWCMFGWKRVKDHSRRYRRFFWTMGRKNGKSCFAAGLALFVAMLDVNPVTGQPENVGEIILCAPKKEQVEKVIYSEIERMRNQSETIEKGSERINKQIRFFHNNTVIRCVGSDRPYSGLNPSFVIMDETHEWAPHNQKFYDTMLTGSGSRAQPLIGSVTTAGDDHSYIWQTEYSTAKGILDGTDSNESLFAYIFELDETDDPLDEATWIKANPNLGVSLKLEYLQEQPKSHPVDLNRFIRFHCNRPVKSVSKAFDIADWDAAVGGLSDWRTADAVGYGVDLGSRDDLSAWAAVARFPIAGARPDGDDDKTVWRYEIVARAYMDEETNRDLSKHPFSSWCGKEITVCKYPTMQLEQDLRRHHEENIGSEIALDPHNAKGLIESLARDGLVPLAVRQTQADFNEPIRDFLQALRSGRVTHDGNPVLRWCVGNAVLKDNSKEEVMFDKSTSNDKIDMIVAGVMAFRVVSRAQARVTGSLYL